MIRNPLYYFTIISLALLFLLIASDFRPQDKSKIIRHWSLVDFRTPRLERNFEQIGVIGIKRKQVVKNLIEGSYIEFKNDGTYEASLMGSDPETLFWDFNASDTTLLVRKLEAEPFNEIPVELLTKRELVILLPDLDGEFTRLYFVASSELD